MKAAIMFTWTRVTAGREAKALEAFTDSLTFWGKLAADGKCGEPMAYLAPSGLGTMIIPGHRETLFEIIGSDEFAKLYTKVRRRHARRTHRDTSGRQERCARLHQPTGWTAPALEFLHEDLAASHQSLGPAGGASHPRPTAHGCQFHDPRRSPFGTRTQATRAFKRHRHPEIRSPFPEPR